MDNNIPTEELLRLENLFIELYNKDFSVADIAKELEVSAELVEKWKVDLEEANELIDFDGYINGKKSNKKYVVSFIPKNSDKEKVLTDFISYIIDSKISLKDESNETIIDYNNIRKNLEFLSIDEENNILDFYCKDDLQRQDVSVALNFWYSQIRGYTEKNKSSKLIKDASDNFYLSKTKHSLSCAIKNIYIENFQGVKRLQIGKLEVDANMIFLTGNNGFGKSSILKALAIGFKMGEEKIEDFDIRTNRIGVEFRVNGSNAINNSSDFTEPFLSLQYLASFGMNRLQVLTAEAESEIGKKSTATYGLFNEDGILLNIMAELVLLNLEKSPKTQKIIDTLLLLSPTLSNIIIEGREVKFIEKDKFGEDCEPVSYDQLSAGYKSIIAMAGDIMKRLFKTQPEVNDPKYLQGIVIIDEIEQHLHPEWQYKLPTLLVKAFPNIQFIVSTHSVAPIMGAPERSIFIKVDRDKENGITAERIDIDVTKLLPNTIFTSPLFDMGKITNIQIESDELDDIRTENTYEELLKNDEIKEKIKQIDFNSERYSDELFKD